ncbi:MAG: hypothetical protein PVI86_08285 [Phycisphaerae bacterium]|jgi:hypothetical protein
MTHEGEKREDLLLDRQLDRLDDSQLEWLDDELTRDETLRAKQRRLQRILEPLDQWKVESTPTDLADRVLAHVAQTNTVGGPPPVLSFENERAARSPFFSMRDLVAVAASIVLLLGLLVPGVAQLRDRSRRTACATNLGSIFRGVSTYQDLFAGSLPYAGTAPDAAWLPVGATDRPYASNSRHLYLLVKLELGPKPAEFVCPSCSMSRPMTGDDLAARTDFAQCCNNSYSSLNLAGCNPNLKPKKAVPYLSDRNPLFVNARFDPSVDPDTTNSPVHRGKGQTVLVLDGHTKWMKTPLYGKKRDNLWLIGNVRKYTGTECCTCPDRDVQLVSGYPITDPVVSRELRE